MIILQQALIALRTCLPVAASCRYLLMLTDHDRMSAGNGRKHNNGCAVLGGIEGRYISTYTAVHKTNHM